jgi:hypothetical protein
VKRLLTTVFCSLLLLANVVTVWAACKQVSSRGFYGHHTTDAEDHRSDSSHEHSDKAGIHCLIIEPFIPTAMSSAKPDRGSVRVVSALASVSAFHDTDGEFHRFMHDPPFLTSSSGVPSYLFISVFRI